MLTFYCIIYPMKQIIKDFTSKNLSFIDTLVDAIWLCIILFVSLIAIYIDMLLIIPEIIICFIWAILLIIKVIKRRRDIKDEQKNNSI